MKCFKKISIFFTLIFSFIMLSQINTSAITFNPIKKDSSGESVPISFYSKSVYMIDNDTAEPIVDINSNDKISPGYLTQLMTCAIILDEFNGNEKQLKDTYISSDGKAFDELYDTGCPTTDIRPNEDVSYYDLLAAMILRSSCEAANISALNLSDSLSSFCSLMNDKAKELNMNDTNFSSPNGFIVSQNYSTARDISKLCKYLIDNYKVFNDISSMEKFELEETNFHPDGTVIYNDNSLLSSQSKYYYPKVCGIKNSVHNSSGRSLASYSSFNGRNYITVSLNAPIEKKSEDIEKGKKDINSVFADDFVNYDMLDHIALYEWAYNFLIPTDFLNPNSEVTDAYVEFGNKKDYVNLKPVSGFSTLWPIDISTDEIEKSVTVYKNIIAPIKKGDVLGKMEFRYNDEIISSVDLIATSSVDRSAITAKLKLIKYFPHSTEFKIAVFIIIMLFVCYFISLFIVLQLKYFKKNPKK